jgi:predicted RNase H-like HicB family nuclease
MIESFYLVTIKNAWVVEEKMRSFIAYIEFDPDTELYIGIVPGLPGAHTQAETLDELQKNLKEVIELCLEEYGNEQPDFPRFIGLQQIEVAV